MSCPKSLHPAFSFLFAVILPIFMANAEDAIHTSLLVSPTPAFSSKFGSPGVSSLDLERAGTRPGSTPDEKLDAFLSMFARFEAQLAQILALANWMSRMESHVSNTFGFAAGLTEMEQTFSALTLCACLCPQMFPDPPLDLGRHQDKVMAPQPRGPVTRARLKKAGIQVKLDKDTSPDGENARSALFLRFLCEQCHAGMSAWLKWTLVPTGQPERIHCKT